VRDSRWAGNAELFGMYMPTFLRLVLPPSLDVKMEGAASSEMSVLCTELHDITSLQIVILRTVMIMSH